MSQKENKEVVILWSTVKNAVTDCISENVFLFTARALLKVSQNASDLRLRAPHIDRATQYNSWQLLWAYMYVLYVCTIYNGQHCTRGAR